MAPRSKSKEIRITRLYDAPVKTVWDAWTDPGQVAQWWGPRGFTLTTHGKDLRPGGFWSYTMHGPDGQDYPNKTRYLEVERYSRLVYDHGGSDDRPPLFRVTVTFREIEGRTRMEMSMALETPEAAEETRKFIKKAGGDATWDRLAEYLGKECAGKDQFVINRAFDASLEQVFGMWAGPEHLSRWLPSDGFTMECLESVRPHRIVYAQQFRGEKGGIVSHSMAPAWPKTISAVVSLVEEGPGRTRVMVVCEPYQGASLEEREAFLKARGGMTQRWTDSFDKLEASLASATGT